MPPPSPVRFVTIIDKNRFSYFDVWVAFDIAIVGSCEAFRDAVVLGKVRVVFCLYCNVRVR